MDEPARPPFPVSVLRDLLSQIRRRFPFPGASSPSRPGPSEAEIAAERLRAQVKVVRRALGDVGTAPAEGSSPPEDDAQVRYLFRPDHVLVRDDDAVERLTTFFGDRQHTYAGMPEPADQRTRETGILLRLPSRTDEQDAVLATLNEIDAELGEGFAVPDHLLYVTYPRICPATEPEVPRSMSPFPPENSDTTAGADVRVSVVDTGLWMGSVSDSNTPWLQKVMPASQADEEQINTAAIHEYGGHGTFVAGIVKCMAPSTRVEVEGMLVNGGAIYESEICEQLHEALGDDDDPQLISISAGTHTRKNLGLLGFEMLMESRGLGEGGRTLVVAAAGNDTSSDPFWPAAFSWVVGVGSVDADGKLSDFSNYGPWVDVYARGRNLVNAFPTGTYTCYEPENIHNQVPDVRHFKSMAQWSGTSFSTPVVTGLIAAEKGASHDIQAAKNAVLGSATVMNGLPVVGPLT